MKEAGILPRITVILFVSLTILSEAVLAGSSFSSSKRFSAADGLPEMTIFSVVEDKHGFLWLGTQTAILRFDGVQFKDFSSHTNNPKKIHLSNPGNLFIDSKDRLWIGSWGDGLAVYDSSMNLIRHFIHDDLNENTLGGNRIQVIFEDASGRIWVGTNGDGLSLLNEDELSFTNFKHDPEQKNSLSHNRVWSITEDNSGAVWVATSNGLNRIDPASRSISHFYASENMGNGFKANLVRSVYWHSDNKLYLGTQRDFGTFDHQTNSFTPIHLPSGGSPATVNKIKPDNNRGLYITSLRGVYHYDTNSQELSDWAGNGQFQLFPQYDIRDTLVGSNNLLWITSRFGGLIRLDLTPSQFEPYNTFNDKGQDKPVGRVFSQFVDASDVLWVGTAHGLLRWNPKTKRFEKFPVSEQALNQVINGITEDKEGNLWLGGSFGLYSLNKDRTALSNTNRLNIDLSQQDINSLLLDNDNFLWVGTMHDGAMRISPQGDVLSLKNDPKLGNSLGGNTILSFFEDRAKNMWIGTLTGGANRFNKSAKDFVRYSAKSQGKNRISDNLINDIHQSKDNTLWFATTTGLNRLNDQSGVITVFDTDDSLPDNNIRSVINDDFDKVWVASARGISHYDPEQNFFIHHSEFHRRSNNTYLAGLASKTRQGDIFFGGSDGIDRLQPAYLGKSTHFPTTKINFIRADDRLYDLDYTSNQLDIVVSHEVKRLDIGYVTLDLRDPAKNLYSHRLIGLDEEWQKPESSNTVTFTRLQPGNYTFEVKGSNSSSQWSHDYPQIHIKVVPPWWEHPLARFFGLAIVLLSMFVFYRYRMRSYKLRHIRLEREVRARTQELRQSNKELAVTINQLNQYQDEMVKQEKMASLGQMVAGVAHEINTPIGLGVTASTVLQLQIEKLQNAYDVKKITNRTMEKFLEESAENAGIIYRNLHRAAELINSFKQVAVDQTSEAAREFNISQLMDEILLSLRPNLKKVKHKVTYDCDPNAGVVSSPGPFSQVIINLIMNSLIHGFEHKDQGKISVKIKVDDDHCVIEYRDNGCGIDKELQPRIYDPFVTTKRGAGGSGLGMHLVYNLVTQALQGTIELKSGPNQGVLFTIVLPAKLIPKSKYE